MDNKPKQKGFAPIIILIVILAALVGFAFYLTKTGAIKKVENLISSPTSSSISTANWKTYTNKVFGVEIKYPIDAKVIERSTTEIQIDNFQPGKEVHGFPIGWMIIIAKPEPLGSLSLIQWAKKNASLSDLLINQKNQTSPTNTTLAGQPAIYWRSTGGDLDALYYLVQNKNNVTLITVNPATGFESTTNQILSTFKFTQ